MNVNAIKAHLRQLKTSDTLCINERSLSLERKGKTIYKFGFGQSPFPVPKVVQEALRHNTHQKAYLPVRGLPELRNAISSHTNELLASTLYTYNNVFVGPGSKELIFLLQTALDLPFILPNPSWVSYAPQARISQNDIHWVPTDIGSWLLDAKTLEDYLIQNRIQGGILILNYPSNPTGAYPDEHQLMSLAKVCRQHGLLVISDEIYGLLSFDGRYRSIAKYYPEGTIISTGLSKWCGAGGYRIGTFIIPDELGYITDILSTLASETFSAVSAPIQYAAVKAYQPCESLVNYRTSSISILNCVAKYCHKKLTECKVQVAPSEGGFYLFPDFSAYSHTIENRDIHNSKSMCERILMDTGIALLPGTAFGRPHHEFTARLSYVDFAGDKALLEWDQNKDYLEPEHFHTMFPKIHEGIQKLCEWLES